MESDDYLRRSFQLMRGRRSTLVEIVFDAYQARWMREHRPFHFDEQREDLYGGSLRLTFTLRRNDLNAVTRFCLAYASHCMAHRPEALRKIIRENLKLALSQHEVKNVDS